LRIISHWFLFIKFTYFYILILTLYCKFNASLTHVLYVVCHLAVGCQNTPRAREQRLARSKGARKVGFMQSERTSENFCFLTEREKRKMPNTHVYSFVMPIFFCLMADDYVLPHTEENSISGWEANTVEDKFLTEIQVIMTVVDTLACVLIHDRHALHTYN
jgi:hypothetical protein